MRVRRTLLFPTITLALSACVSAAPLTLNNDNPASPNAAAGLVDAATATDDYKSPDDFANRAAADANAPQPAPMSHEGMGGMGNMTDMKGMQRGDMQHGGASQGGAPQ